MREIKIKFKEFGDVAAFIEIANKTPGEMLLRSGRYTVNAKSILGIYSLDLRNELTLRIPNEVDTSLFKQFQV